MIDHQDNWKPLGLAAMRVLLEVERRRQAERVFGPLSTQGDQKKIYPQHNVDKERRYE